MKNKPKQIKPLLDIHCITEPYCQYPVAVRITMEDGSIQTYELKNKMEYKCGQVMTALAKMEVGYEYRGRHEKSRVHKGKL